MNITDITDVVPTPLNIWAYMYNMCLERQKTYHEVEKDIGYGLLARLEDFHIDQRRSQYLLKDFKWRIVEEIAEAMEAFSKGELEHYQEELIDALIFYMNLFCLLESCPSPLKKEGEGIPEPQEFMTVIVLLGLSANHLKNKPWKQSEMKTDQRNYLNKVHMSFVHFQNILLKVFGEDQKIFEIFFKKQKVNEFRTESNY